MIFQIYLWSAVFCAIIMIIAYFGLRNSKFYEEYGTKGYEQYVLILCFIPIVNTFIVISFLKEVLLQLLLEYIVLYYRFIRFKIYKIIKS